MLRSCIRFVKEIVTGNTVMEKWPGNNKYKTKSGKKELLWYYMV